MKDVGVERRCTKLRTQHGASQGRRADAQPGPRAYGPPDSKRCASVPGNRGRPSRARPRIPSICSDLGRLVRRRRSERPLASRQPLRFSARGADRLGCRRDPRSASRLRRNRVRLRLRLPDSRIADHPRHPDAGRAARGDGHGELCATARGLRPRVVARSSAGRPASGDRASPLGAMALGCRSRPRVVNAGRGGGR